MSPPTAPPSIAVLNRLWGAAVLLGVLAFALGLGWVAAEAALDMIWVIMAFGLAVLVYSAAYYALCTAFAPGLAGYMTGEDVRVEGGDVVHEVTHAESGREKLDFHIRAFVVARQTTQALIGAAVLVGLAVGVFGW